MYNVTFNKLPITTHSKTNEKVYTCTNHYDMSICFSSFYTLNLNRITGDDRQQQKTIISPKTPTQTLRQPIRESVKKVHMRSLKQFFYNAPNTLD